MFSTFNFNIRNPTQKTNKQTNKQTKKKKKTTGFLRSSSIKKEKKKGLLY